MGGSAMRSGSNYSTWWDGGLRTTAYFHNEIGILTEIIGGPNPQQIPLVPDKQLPQGDWPLPVVPQLWHYRQSVDYDFQLNRAILDYASRNRETLLFNIWQMGENSIKRGSEDNWTITPKRIDAFARRCPRAGVDEAVVGDGRRRCASKRRCCSRRRRLAVRGAIRGNGFVRQDSARSGAERSARIHYSFGSS